MTFYLHMSTQILRLSIQNLFNFWNKHVIHVKCWLTYGQLYVSVYVDYLRLLTFKNDLPTIITINRTVVIMATPKNILNRSSPIKWIFSSSWLDTMVEGITKPNATPSCQNRSWCTICLSSQFLFIITSYLIAKNADSTSRRHLVWWKPRGGQLRRNTQNENLRNSHNTLTAKH